MIFGGGMGEPYWPQRVLQQSGCKLRIYAKLAEYAKLRLEYVIALY